MILIDRTFESVTDESAEHGEAAETGFIAENEPVTFRELVQLHFSPSNAPHAARYWRLPMLAAGHVRSTQ